MERLFASALGTMDVFTVYLGDRLGLYRMLAQHGPLTAGELAERAGMYARYAREWLEQQAATAILEVDDAAKPEQERRFSLPAGRAEALIDPESRYAMAALCRSLAVLGGVLPKLVDAYRTGEGVAVEGADAVEAQGDFNRPWLVGSFATEYLPLVPDVHEKLKAGARVADVACGVGWAAVSIARGYPTTTVDGFDLDEPAIALARSIALDAGVADRVTFQARDAADPSLVGQYDLAVIVEALHDMPRPVDVLASVRRLLAPGGTLIVADERWPTPSTRRRARPSASSTATASWIACRTGWSRSHRRRPAPSCGDRPWSATPRQRGSRRCRSCPSSTTSYASTGSTRSGSRGVEGRPAGRRHPRSPQSAACHPWRAAGLGSEFSRWNSR